MNRRKESAPSFAPIPNGENAFPDASPVPSEPESAFSTAPPVPDRERVPSGASPVPDALPEDVPLPFVLLDAVEEAGPERLVALRRFAASPVWQGLEAAAQAAALHQRFLAGFARHAFLLSVDACRFPEGALDGPYRIRASLLGQSSRAASYRVELEPVCSGKDGMSSRPVSAAEQSHTGFMALRGRDAAPNPGTEAHPDVGFVPSPGGKAGSGGDSPSSFGREAHCGGPASPGDDAACRCGREAHCGGFAGSGMEAGSGDGTPPGGDAERPGMKGGCAGDPVPMEAHPGDSAESAGGVAAWSVDLGVGLADYGGAFRRELLEPRYRRLFQWLTTNVPCATVSNSG